MDEADPVDDAHNRETPDEVIPDVVPERGSKGKTFKLLSKQQIDEKIEKSQNNLVKLKDI